MKQREKRLAAIFVVTGVAWLGWQFAVPALLGPLDDGRTRLRLLDNSAKTLEDDEFNMLAAQRRMADWKSHSLPPDPLEAQRLYQEWLTDLAEMAEISALRVAPERISATTANFKTVRLTIKGEATFDQLTTFLHYFERADLLQRIASLKIESPDANANTNGKLKVTLAAEGLCLPDAEPRSTLFPQSELAGSLPRTFGTLKVASTKGFPTSGEFGIRIEDEFLTVTKVAGNEWTVMRGIDGTTKARHPDKAEVELFPVRYDRREILLGDQKKALASHPFMKSVPNAPRVDDAARQTRLMASNANNEDREAWLFNKSANARTKVTKGASIAVGDVKGVVVSIEPGFIQIDRGGALWQLNLGKDLASMTRVGADDEGGGDAMLDFQGGESPRGSRGPDGGNRSRSRRSRRGGGSDSQ
jgi:hypothetical protein